MRVCPLCGSEVKGDSKTGYYCRRCNLLFEERETRIVKDVDAVPAGSLVKGSEKVGSEEAASTNNAQKDLPSKIFITSAKAKRYHVLNCPFAQKIRPEKRITFRSAEEAERQGYKPCECTKGKTEF